MLRLFALILMLLLANTHGLRQRDKSPFRAKLSPQRLLDKWSRNLCGTLRHKALKQGLPMGSDGFVRVSDILRHPAYSRLSWDMLQKVVGTDSKRRFQLTPIAPSFDGMEATKGDMYAWHIRACQGHSVRLIEDDSLLQPLTSTEDLFAKTGSRLVIHGTKRRFLPSIFKEGLRAMSRNHMHFAITLPASAVPVPAANATAVAADTPADSEPPAPPSDPAPSRSFTGLAISGIRSNSEVGLTVDMDKAIADGILFFLSDNFVVLTRGVNNMGSLPAMYFKEIIALDGKAAVQEEVVEDAEKEEQIGVGRREL